MRPRKWVYTYVLKGARCDKCIPESLTATSSLEGRRTAALDPAVFLADALPNEGTMSLTVQSSVIKKSLSSAADVQTNLLRNAGKGPMQRATVSFTHRTGKVFQIPQTGPMYSFEEWLLCLQSPGFAYRSVNAWNS